MTRTLLDALIDAIIPYSKLVLSLLLIAVLVRGAYMYCIARGPSVGTRELGSPQQRLLAGAAARRAALSRRLQSSMSIHRLWLQTDSRYTVHTNITRTVVLRSAALAL